VNSALSKAEYTGDRSPRKWTKRKLAPHRRCLLKCPHGFDWMNTGPSVTRQAYWDPFLGPPGGDWPPPPIMGHSREKPCRSCQCWGGSWVPEGQIRAVHPPTTRGDEKDWGSYLRGQEHLWGHCVWILTPSLSVLWSWIGPLIMGLILFISIMG
jgi:hypothetical protein